MTLTLGSWQKEMMESMMREHGCPSPTRVLHGRAKSYMGHYVRSFNNLLDKMRAAGYSIERTPGVRGGEWGATYKAKKQ